MGYQVMRRQPRTVAGEHAVREERSRISRVVPDSPEGGKNLKNQGHELFWTLLALRFLKTNIIVSA